MLIMRDGGAMNSYEHWSRTPNKKLSVEPCYWLNSVFLLSPLVLTWEHLMHWELGTWTCGSARWHNLHANTPKGQDQQRQQRYWFIAVAFHPFVTVVVAIHLHLLLMLLLVVQMPDMGLLLTVAWVLWQYSCTNTSALVIQHHHCYWCFSWCTNSPNISTGLPFCSRAAALAFNMPPWQYSHLYKVSEVY